MPISVDNAVGDKYTCLAKKLSNYIYGSKIHMCQNPNCFWELITLQQSVVYIGIRRVISQKFPNLPRKCIKLCVVCIWNYAEFLKYRTPSYRSLTHTALFHHKNAIATVAQFINLLPQQSGFFCPRSVYHAKAWERVGADDHDSRSKPCTAMGVSAHILRVRFEPERTGTPFLVLFLITGIRRSGPFRHIAAKCSGFT